AFLLRRQEVFTIFFRLSLKGLESRFLQPCHVFRVAAVPCQWERIIGSQNFCARAFYKKKDRLPIF
ncbi:hypothetical protein AAEH88_21310, partial [Shewanella algae]|uniref:hypothetical protein n=2 Tax=Shewanella algae TaxID=38313 RepID=UPI00313B0CDF